MRKEYRKAVRELFTQGLRSRLPQFEPKKVNAPILFSGESVFCWEASHTLHCFVLLVPDSRGHQSFTIELAWSHAARFPDVSSKPTLLLGPGDPDPVDISEGIVRLGGILSRKDMWWDLPDPTLQRPGDLAALQKSIEPVSASVARERAVGPVEACLVALEGDGVDFFRRLASRGGALLSGWAVPYNKHSKQSQAFGGSAIGYAACTSVLCLRSLADPLAGPGTFPQRALSRTIG